MRSANLLTYLLTYLLKMKSRRLRICSPVCSLLYLVLNTDRVTYITFMATPR